MRTKARNPMMMRATPRATPTPIPTLVAALELFDVTVTCVAAGAEIGMVVELVLGDVIEDVAVELIDELDELVEKGDKLEGAGA